ncbi:sensor histidine kinase [Planomonospora parontospora]|uniref:sensor histidine kinase n=1 Tax=Planomonospora parontospora TaxID=58119 RepID=UPI0016709243|nr:GAF domain-containing sensor histidine kinase [Planomonospora parontospora]GGL58844.1 sensor histidine kinase [Planomonospora parontospora subsp. antibiotica]GII20232.1 sensor histidine kinase [Planomonospora parontospora subsp. antibiotica]
MTSVPRPPDEDERVAELAELQSLRTVPEPDFSAIAELAATVCQTPIALVTLVGADGQEYKGRVGVTATHGAREATACAYVICGRQVLEIPDALADSRFRENPWVTGPPYVRFYAGAPIVSSHDHALGAVAVMDHVPRRLSPPRRQALITLGASTAGLLEAHHYTQRADEIIHRLRDVEELKNQFLRTVNHELRTPLTSIGSYLQLIQDGDLDEVTEQRFLRVIERNSHRILRLIDELLLIASLNARTASHRPARTDLVALARRTVDRFIPDARTGQLDIRLHAPEHVMVWADAGRLEHALDQVVDNAVKFTPPGGNVDVAVIAGPVPAVEVRDSGIGIDPADIDHVLKDFYRAPGAEERAIGGTGVGLAITDKIVTMHGGEVRISSRPGHGTCVRITLPAATGGPVPVG